jgi:hypothetical protein
VVGAPASPQTRSLQRDPHPTRLRGSTSPLQGEVRMRAQWFGHMQKPASPWAGYFGANSWLGKLDASGVLMTM